MIQGSCYCGACEFELQRQPRIVAHCHCSICQRIHGAAYGTFAQLPFKYFAWSASSETPRRFASTPWLNRYFCGTCGSPLMHCPSGAAPKWAAVSLACVHQGLEVAPLAHCFVADKPSWGHLPDDGRPRFDTLPEDHDG